MSESYKTCGRLPQFPQPLLPVSPITHTTMNTLSTIFAALASASVVLALKGCPNGGTGVGLRTICVGGGNPDSGFTGSASQLAPDPLTH
jgi:hypothetical protein